MKLAFYQGISLISKLIRWQTRGLYSHVAFLFDDGTVIEAWEEGGVLHNATLSMRHTPGTVVDIFEFSTTIEQETAITKFLRAQLGKKYDYLAVARFISRRNVQFDESKWFCSELAYCGAKVAGIELLKRTEGWKISPDALSHSPLLELVKTVRTGLI